MGLSFTLDDRDREYLGQQAVRSIETALAGDAKAEPAAPQAGGALARQLGAFVTLSHGRDLRGCIGTIIAHEPLWLNAWRMARAAAFEDPRFPPLAAAEWPAVSVEITVLDQPAPCPDPGAIVIGRDGLILSFQGRTGVFLPQVPVEQGWDLDAYLSQLCRKAGVPQGSWANPDARLYWYQALAFPVRRV